MVSLRFGALAPALAEQLAAYPLAPETVEHWQRDHDAISRLWLRGLLTDSERQRAYTKLGRVINREVNHVLAAARRGEGGEER